MSNSPLLQPFDLRGLELKNRVVLAPLTRARAGKDRVPNALMGKYYSQRASAGLVISEGTTIGEQANGWTESAGIYTDAHVEGWKPVVQAVHDAGGVFFCQLWHCGRASHPDFHDGEPQVAPSAIKIEGDEARTPEGKKPHVTPRALETDEIPDVVDLYRQAAKRAKAAGFDGVEIHGANGYLIDEFLQSKTNHRTDAYGGSIENRYRFLDEIVQAIGEVYPTSRIGVRQSPNGAFNDMGSPDYREQFLYVAEKLSAYGLAYLHVMDGLAFGFHDLGEPLTLADYRKVFDGPLMGNCGYVQESAEAAIASGDADLISFGRPYISNPDLVERFANGWPLADPAPVSAWYSHDAEGYADFPTYKDQLASTETATA
ncbi:N-ethylmaleimide reductase [Botrimarina colliarenosi]|uniref:N-ethylmaleimide reductase n=1 Tax=Botrimarina colliarenosi TaxID=2528001 RepID=A0A5C6ACG9_9BACT|nr:alkene reductase [Botrimarina colliarenosi]TWT97087.1 N-ethylmaleimide reductase [Botrimarina colliarenosi]